MDPKVSQLWTNILFSFVEMAYSCACVSKLFLVKLLLLIHLYKFLFRFKKKTLSLCFKIKLDGLERERLISETKRYYRIINSFLDIEIIAFIYYFASLTLQNSLRLEIDGMYAF